MIDLFDFLRRFGGAAEQELQELQKLLSEKFTFRQTNKIGRHLKEAYNKAPQIALVGKTGVGKSSTINALFSPSPPFKVGHVVATTKRPRPIKVSLDGARGQLVVVDFPGLGESIRADEKLTPLYKKHLPQYDVALWILKADDRTLAQDQLHIRDVLTPALQERLVIGLDQIDQIQPGKWIDEFNVPSKEQEESIKLKVVDVRRKLKEIGVRPEHVVPYSAFRGYHLVHLFSVMLKACPLERAWVLDGRKKILPYTRVAERLLSLRRRH